MKKHLIFLTFVFSVVCAFNSYQLNNFISVLGWSTAAITSLDHFLTLRKFD